MKLNKAIFILIFLSFLMLIALYSYENFYKKGIVLGTYENCNPINFRKEERDGVFYLIWETKEDCFGWVKFGVNNDNFPYYGVNNNGQVRTKYHEIRLSGVEKGNTYYFVIISGEKTYGKDGLPINITF